MQNLLSLVVVILILLLLNRSRKHIFQAQISDKIKNIEKCFKCSSFHLVEGTVKGQKGAAWFYPKDLKFKFTLNTYSALPVDYGAYICMDCGLCIATINPEKVKEILKELGNEELKRKLNL